MADCDCHCVPHVVLGRKKNHINRLRLANKKIPRFLRGYQTKFYGLGEFPRLYAVLLRLLLIWHFGG